MRQAESHRDGRLSNRSMAQESTLTHHRCSYMFIYRRSREDHDVHALILHRMANEQFERSIHIPGVHRRGYYCRIIVEIAFPCVTRKFLVVLRWRTTSPFDVEDGTLNCYKILNMKSYEFYMRVNEKVRHTKVFDAYRNRG